MLGVNPDRPGVYAYNSKYSDESVHYFNYVINDYYPKITAKGVEERTDLFKGLKEYVCGVKRPKNYFFYAVVHKDLENFEGYSLFPSVAAERMRVLMVKNVQTTFPLAAIVKRASIANYCVLNFPISRKQFCWVDPMRDALNYGTVIRLPKAVIDKTKVDRYNLVVDDEDIKESPEEVDLGKMKVPAVYEPEKSELSPLGKIAALSFEQFMVLANSYYAMWESDKLSTEPRNEFSYLIEMYGGKYLMIYDVLVMISTSEKPLATGFQSLFEQHAGKAKEKEKDYSDSEDDPISGGGAPPLGSISDTIPQLFSGITMNEDFSDQ